MVWGCTGGRGRVLDLLDDAVQDVLPRVLRTVVLLFEAERFAWASPPSLPRGVTAATEQLLHRNVQRFRGGLVFKAHRLLYHSTLGLRVIKKRRRSDAVQDVLPRVLHKEREFFIDNLLV